VRGGNEVFGEFGQSTGMSLFLFFSFFFSRFFHTYALRAHIVE